MWERGGQTRVSAGTWVGAEAVEDVHHVGLFVILAEHRQPLPGEVEHRPLAAPIRLALPAARLRMHA